MFSPTSAYGHEDPTIDDPSVSELADNLEDPHPQKKLAAKGSLASMTSMLTTESQSSWRKYRDDASNTDYYYDHTTGESRWDLPEGADLVSDDENDYENEGEEEEVGPYDEMAANPNDLYISPDKSMSQRLSSPIPSASKGNSSSSRRFTSPPKPSTPKDEVTKKTSEGGGGREGVVRFVENLNQSSEEAHVQEGIEAPKKEDYGDNFEQLKTGASVVAISGAWLQWQSQQGATFYTQGDSGGQWERPPDFKVADKEPVIARNTMSLSKSMREKLKGERGSDDVGESEIQLNDKMTNKEKNSRRKSGGLHEHQDLSDLGENLKLMEDLTSTSNSPSKSLRFTDEVEDIASHEPSSPVAADSKSSFSQSPSMGKILEVEAETKEDEETMGDIFVQKKQEEKGEEPVALAPAATNPTTPALNAPAVDASFIPPRDESKLQPQLAETSIVFQSSAPATDNGDYYDSNADAWEEQAEDMEYKPEMSNTSHLPPEIAEVKKRFAEMQSRDRSAERSIRYDTGEKTSRQISSDDLYREMADSDRNLEELSKSFSELKERASIARQQFSEAMRRSNKNFDDSDIYNPDYIEGPKGEQWEELRKLKEKRTGYDFTHVYGRSLVAQQKWPWSMMVDPENEIVFYKNELTGEFQGEKPDVFIKSKDETEKYVQVSNPTNKTGFNIPRIELADQEKSKEEYDAEYKREIIERQKNVSSQSSIDKKIKSMQMTDHFQAHLIKIVQQDKTSTAAQDLEDRKSKAIQKIMEEREHARIQRKKKDFSNQERSCSRRNSLFKLSSLHFIMSIDEDDIADVVKEQANHDLYDSRGRGFSKGFGTFHRDESAAKIEDSKWQESLMYLDRLRRMDMTPGVTKTTKTDNYSDERLAAVTKSLRKSREEFQKSGAFSATGKNIPRTFAPGIKGVEATSFDPIVGPTFQPPTHRFGAGQDPMHIMQSSLPNSLKSSMSAAEIPDKVVSTVERANPMPIVGPSKMLRAGDLMSRFQTMKFEELADMARARRNVALDELKLKYDSSRIESHKQKIQGEVIKDHINKMFNLIHEGEKSWLHGEIAKRHLLEATVMLEGTLPKPLNTLDASSYRHTPLHFRNPESMKPEELLLSACEQMTVEHRADFRWGILHMNSKQSSSKAMKKKSHRFVADTTIPNRWTIYINRATGCVQTGKPFDLRAREIYHEDRVRVNEKTKEGKNVLDVPVELVKMRNSTLRFEPPQPQDLAERKHFRVTEYMTDSDEGILYYCPSRHLFSSIGKFDNSVSYYDTRNANVFKSYDYLHIRVPAKNIWETLSLLPIDTSTFEEKAPEIVEEPSVVELKLDTDMEEFLDLANLLKESIKKTSEELVTTVKESAVTKLMRKSLIAEHPELDSPKDDDNVENNGDNEVDLMMETVKSEDFQSPQKKTSVDQADTSVIKNPTPSPKKGKRRKNVDSPPKNETHHRWDAPQIQVATTKRDTSMLGILTVKLLSCSDLINADADTFGGLSDPYVILTIGKSQRISKRQKNTLNPFFNEEFKFKWNGTDSLRCKVMDYDMGNGDNTDDPMGDVEISLQHLDFSNKVVHKIYEKKLENVSKGKITMEMWFQPFSGHTYKYDPPKQVVYFQAETISRVTDKFQNFNVDLKKCHEYGDKKFLSFELFLQEDANDDEEHEYNILMADVYRRPRDALALVALSRYLLSRGCGQQALVALIRALECLSCKENMLSKQDSAMLHILAVRMAAKYAKQYAGHALVRECATVCPNSAAVIGHSGKYLARMQLPREAEELYIGSLLLNPTTPDALRGYALMLAEQGNFAVALRYISRVDSSASCSNIAMVEKGWMLELKGDSSEASSLVYQKVISTNERNSNAISNALTALGHLAHIRGDFPKALSFYRRAGEALDRNDNDLALILRGCAAASIITSPNYTKSETSAAFDTLEQACAMFRRGLFFMKNSSRWIALLAYGQFTAYVKNDIHNAEAILWNSTNLSISRVIWPAIALAHLYQYACNKYAAARKCLIWAKRRRFEGLMVKTYASNTIDDSVALQVVLTHLYLEIGDVKEAEYSLGTAIDMDPQNTTVLRCRSLIHLKKDERDRAFKYIDLAMNHSTTNTYTMRTASIMYAMQGKYKDACTSMQNAVALDGVSFPLSWRILGIMTYLYCQPNNEKHEKRVDVIAKAIMYLGRANELARGIDVESIYLMAQLLMEIGHFKEAEVHLRAALVLAPTNSVVLATLALCLVALGYRSPQGVDRIDYRLKQSIMSDFTDITDSNDPEELFELAINPVLAGEIAAKNLNVVENNVRQIMDDLELDGNYRKGRLDGDKGVKPFNDFAGSDEKNVDIQPEVLYWYGMYQLQRHTAKKGGERAKNAARSLFERAARRSDCLPYPPAVYMLGWMHELDGELDAAERCYVYAVQLDPVEAGDLLRLNSLIKSTHEYVSMLAGVSENRHRRTVISKDRAKKFLAKKRRAAMLSDDEDDNVDDSEYEDRFNDGAEEMFMNMGPTQAWNFDKKTRKRKFKVPHISVMKVRLVLHERLSQLMDLRLNGMKKFVSGLNTPGKFVLLEPFWMDRALQSFSVCDDWASLLRSSKEFRSAQKN